MSSKKPKTKNIKNILETPFQIKWLEKDLDEIVPVKNALKKLLPVAKLEKTPIKLQFKRKKEEKETSSKILKAKNQNVHRTYLTPGFQSVVRGLEKGELCSLVVSSDIAPAMLLKVLLVQAQVNGVPLLVIPGLKTLTKSTLGFSAMVLGFKNIVAESPGIQFHEIYQMISQNPTLIEAPAFAIKAERVNESCKELTEDLEKKSFKPQPLKTENVYLYRSVNGKRAFTPENKGTQIINPGIKNQIDEDFIFIEKGSESSKKPVNIKKNVIKRISDDEDDSSDEIGFFVDTKADEDLMERLQPMMDIDVEKANPTSNNKTLQQNQNKHTSKKKKNMVDRLSQLSKVSFKPLQIKTITGNSKRSKTKQKKKT